MLQFDGSQRFLIPILGSLKILARGNGGHFEFCAVKLVPRIFVTGGAAKFLLNVPKMQNQQ